MKRVLEPELMEDPVQVIAYAEADFDEPHNGFVQRLKRLINNPLFNGKTLDLGCGSGDISRRFAIEFPHCLCDAIDGSKPMIDYARDSISQTLLHRINFIHAKLPVAQLPHAPYNIIFSNSLLHHLPEPNVLWQTIINYSSPGTFVAVMDLIRPDSETTAQALVKTYTANEPEVLQRDFYYSLLAAFTADEINLQLAQSRLPLTAEIVSDRHVFISGIIR